MAVNKKAAGKVRKKVWVQIVAPTTFDQQQLGETYVYEPEVVIGKHIEVNAMNLTGDMKKQNYNVSFVVDSIKEKKAHTRWVGYSMQTGAIRRLVRREQSKIEESFQIATQDNANVRIKVIAVTRGKLHNSTEAALRKILRAFIVASAKKMPLEQLTIEVISGKLQKAAKDKANKIHPIRILEVKAMQMLGEMPSHGEQAAQNTEIQEEPQNNKPAEAAGN